MNKLKSIWYKINGKKTILFSMKEDWKEIIDETIKKTHKNVKLFYSEFNQVNVSNFNYVIPLTVKAQEYANKHQIFKDKKNALIPSKNCIEICDKKDKFEKFMLNNGFEDFYPSLENPKSFPYVIKKTVDEFGLNTKIIKNAQDEQKYSKLISSKEYIKQNYITGKDEYTSHIIIKNNKIIYLNTLVYYFKEELFVKGKYWKEKSRVKVNHEHFKSIFEKILTTMNYKQGICCFNYKVVKNQIKIFEINPRFGGSLIQYVDEALPIYMKAIDSK